MNIPMLDLEQIPEEWLTGLSWDLIDECQKGLNTSCRFTPEDLNTFKQAIAFGHYFLMQLHGNTKAGTHQVMMIPADSDDANHGDTVPVLGFSNKAPVYDPEAYASIPTGMPDFMGQLEEYVKEVMRPTTSEDYKGKVVAKIKPGTSRDPHSSLVEFEEGMVPKFIKDEVVPSCWLSHTDKTIHVPRHPSFAVTRITPRDSRSMVTVTSIGDKVRSMLPANSRYMVQYGNQKGFQFILFGDEPTTKRDTKLNMFSGRSRHHILGNRIFFNPAVRGNNG